MAEKLGLFTSQLVEGRFQEVNISYIGDITENDLTPLTLSLVKGLLAPILKETVNFVNAINIAKERGIKIQEVRNTKEEEFVTLIKVEVKTDTVSKVVCGTLSANKQPRIVKIDDYYMEVAPVGDMLMIRNLDVPGIIGNLGTLLGKHNINVAAMSFGRRDQRGDEALSVINIDNPVSVQILEQIKGIKNILAVKLIRL